MAYEFEDYSRKQDNLEKQRKADLVVDPKTAFLAKNHLHYDQSEHPMNDLVLREMLKRRTNMSTVDSVIENIALYSFLGMLWGCFAIDTPWVFWITGLVVLFVTLFLVGEHLAFKNNLLTLAGFNLKKDLNKANLFAFLKIALNNSAITGTLDNEREKMFTKFVEAMFDEKSGTKQLMHASDDIVKCLIRGYRRVDQQLKDDKHSVELNSFVSNLSQEELEAQFKSQLLYDTLKGISSKNK